MAKIREYTTPRVENVEDARRALEELTARLNEVIRALNTLLP